MGILKYLAIEHIGIHHSGLWDCVNIANIFRKMVDDGYEEPNIKQYGFTPKKRYRNK